MIISFIYIDNNENNLLFLWKNLPFTFFSNHLQYTVVGLYAIFYLTYWKQDREVYALLNCIIIIFWLSMQKGTQHCKPLNRLYSCHSRPLFQSHQIKYLPWLRSKATCIILFWCVTHTFHDQINSRWKQGPSGLFSPNLNFQHKNILEKMKLCISVNSERNNSELMFCFCFSRLGW